MRGYICAVTAFIALLPLSSYAVQKNDCYTCHEKKGRAAFIDRALYEESSHGKFSCSRCHLDIQSYPHGKTLRVSCGICHFLGTGGAPKEEAYKYKLSVHGKAAKEGKVNAPDCQTCHGSHYIFSSKDERALTQRQRIPLLCSGCHNKEYESYSKSIHGKVFVENKNPGAATCFDCHMEHLIPRVSEKEWKIALIKECGNCHARELDTYRRTFHGKVARLGYTTIAKCSDCHGAHNILPSSDKNSTLSENYILYTCRECHPGATMQFTKFYAHADEHDRNRYPLLYYTYISMTVLLMGVFAFFFTHTFLWAYRAMREKMKKDG